MRTIGSAERMTIQAPVLYDDRGVELDRFTVSFWEAVRRHALDGAEGPGTFARPFPYSAPAHGNSAELAGGADFVHDGSWMLADYGCGMEARLIVNGPLFGQVWVCTLEDDCLPFREFASLHSELELPEPATASFSFNQWYEHWLSARELELSKGR